MDDPLVAGLPCIPWCQKEARQDAQRKSHRRFTRAVIGRTHTRKDLMVTMGQNVDGGGSNHGHGAGRANVDGVVQSTETV